MATTTATAAAPTTTTTTTNHQKYNQVHDENGTGINHGNVKQFSNIILYTLQNY
jgi:hypothetical protein